MKVVVLAAGQSKRMKPVGDKNFLSFLGKPLILHQLEMLKEAGFDDVVVVAGSHNVDRVNNVCTGAEVVVQANFDAGMKNAVLAAKDFLEAEPVLIFSSNDVVDLEAFELVMKAYEAGEADSYILGKKVSGYFPGGYLETDGSVITGIVEKPGAGNEPSNLVNLVVHLHGDGKKLVEYLEEVESDSDDHYEVALDKMIKDGTKIQAVEYEGFWQPIKFPWHVHKVFEHLISRTDLESSKDVEVATSAVFNGKVILGTGVRVFDGAVINGPAYIGAGSVVATNSFVRNSQVGEKCVIGFGTEVARSFLGHDVWRHSNYVGDSVIGNNVSFGAGTVTGNLRLDEAEVGESGSSKFGLVTGDDVRAGINVSFMPGVRIGNRSFIGAGIVVGQDIEDGKYVRGSFELKISDNKSSVEKRDKFE